MHSQPAETSRNSASCRKSECRCMVLGNFQCHGVLLILIIGDQRRTVLAVSTGRVVRTFLLSSIISLFSVSGRWPVID